MKIYTKTGDKGETSLATGERVSKCSARLESYGTVDELNAHVGLLIALGADDVLLPQVQRCLFTVGGALAGARVCVVKEADIAAVEQAIDRVQALLPALHTFILPGGTVTAAQAHVCRTVCRRAERDVLRLRDSGEEVDDPVITYLNRLSDYFFVLARKLAGTDILM